MLNPIPRHRFRYPGVIIFRVFDAGSVFGHQQRAESVHHDGQFAGFFGADAFFHRAGVRAVRDAAGVQRDHAALHVFAAHEVAVHVIEHLIGVNVGVVVGCGNRERVVVVHARHEGADHKVVPVEGLVYRRRHVQATRDRLEIVDAEREGIHETVPAHHVERMIEVVVGVNVVLLFNVKQEIAALVISLQISGFANVALTERRMFHQLAVVVAVAFRRGDGAVTFHDEQAVFFAVELQLVRRAARDHEVVAVFKIQGAVHRAQRAGAFVHKNYLVGIGVFVVVTGHAFARRGKNDFAVVVHQYRLARLEVVVLRLDVKTFQTPVFQLLVVHRFGRNAVRLAHLHDLCGCVAVIEQRVVVAETLGAEQFFVVERAVGFAELGVAFGRYFSKSVVVHKSGGCGWLADSVVWRGKDIYATRKIFSILRPFANSSTNLSKYLICCVKGFSISSTRSPQITPVMR